MGFVRLGPRPDILILMGGYILVIVSTSLLLPPVNSTSYAYEKEGAD